MKNPAPKISTVQASSPTPQGPTPLGSTPLGSTPQAFPLNTLRSLRRSGPVGLRAFTLIELLSVIAVITVLMAILIPAVSAVRASAHSAECTSNLRQIGVAAQLYTQEHNHYLVTGNTGNNAAGAELGESGMGWFHVLRPYFDGNPPTKYKSGVSRIHTFTCPGDPNEGGQSRKVTHLERKSYAVNFAFHQFLVDSGYTKWPKTFDLDKSPADLIHFSDHDWEGANSTSWTDPVRLERAPAMSEWHKGKINLLMVDGSVRNVPLVDVLPDGKQVDLWSFRYQLGD